MCYFSSKVTSDFLNKDSIIFRLKQRLEKYLTFSDFFYDFEQTLSIQVHNRFEFKVFMGKVFKLSLFLHKNYLSDQIGGMKNLRH